jgi:hypothetical protein
MPEALIEIGETNHREHVDAGSQRDVGERELIAAQPRAAVGKAIVHFRHLLKHDFLAIGD